MLRIVPFIVALLFAACAVVEPPVLYDVGPELVLDDPGAESEGELEEAILVASLRPAPMAGKWAFNPVILLGSNKDAADADAEKSAAKSVDDSALARQVQNPISNLISLPIQNNISFGLGSHDRVQNVTNIQPVYPFNVGDWNIITRTIAPLIYQPYVAQKSGGDYGLGDINFTAFFSPADSTKVTWGLGPVLSMPTATKDTLGSRKWSAGPSGVVLVMTGHWVIGCLANNVWSFAGSSSADSVNQMLIQYFVNYNLDDGWYLTSTPILTANWKAEKGGDIWTVPVGGGVGKIFKIGKQPVNAQIQAFYMANSPSVGPNWQLRLQLQFLFPK